MAFNAWPSRTRLSFMTQDKNQAPAGSPQRNNFTTEEQKDQEFQETGKGKADGKNWILDDIGFDKIDKLLLPRQEEEEKVLESTRKSMPQLQ